MKLKVQTRSFSEDLPYSLGENSDAVFTCLCSFFLLLGALVFLLLLLVEKKEILLLTINALHCISKDKPTLDWHVILVRARLSMFKEMLFISLK